MEISMQRLFNRIIEQRTGAHLQIGDRLSDIQGRIHDVYQGISGMQRFSQALGQQLNGLSGITMEPAKSKEKAMDEAFSDFKRAYQRPMPQEQKLQQFEGFDSIEQEKAGVSLSDQTGEDFLQSLIQQLQTPSMQTPFTQKPSLDLGLELGLGRYRRNMVDGASQDRVLNEKSTAILDKVNHSSLNSLLDDDSNSGVFEGIF